MESRRAAAARPRQQFGILRPEPKPPGARLSTILKDCLTPPRPRDGASQRPNSPPKVSLTDSLAIHEAWNEIAAEHATICKPGKLDPATKSLQVVVKNSRHASVIRWTLTHMVERIAQLHQPDTVDQIHVVIVPPRPGAN